MSPRGPSYHETAGKKRSPVRRRTVLDVEGVPAHEPYRTAALMARRAEPCPSCKAVVFAIQCACGWEVGRA